jgi:hypothetical protein
MKEKLENELKKVKLNSSKMKAFFCEASNRYDLMIKIKSKVKQV